MQNPKFYFLQSFRFCVCDHLRPKDSYGAFLDHWVNCFGVFKFRVSEAAVHNGNTRLQHMLLALEYSSVYCLQCAGMFSVSFKWTPLKTSCSYLRMAVFILVVQVAEHKIVRLDG